MSSKTIELKKPFEFFDKIITSITINEPTGRNYADFGEPFLYVRNPDGAIYTVEQTDVIRRYLEACTETVVAKGNPGFEFLSLSDVKQMKRALFDFFTDADEALYSTSATPSSSDAKLSPSPTATA